MGDLIAGFYGISLVLTLSIVLGAFTRQITKTFRFDQGISFHRRQHVQTQDWAQQTRVDDDAPTVR